MRTILSLLLLVFALNLLAQNDKIKAIKDLYYSINNDMPFQTRTVSMNTMHAAIGMQTTNIKFWFLSEQTDPEEDPYETTYTPVKVQVNYNIAAGMNYTIEYLLNEKGELVFYFKQAKGEWENYTYRYYFDQNKLIKVMIKSINETGLKIDYTDTANFKEKDLEYAKECIENAKQYVDFFDIMTNIEYLDK